MRTRFRKTGLGAVALLAAGASLAACGSSGGNSNSASSSNSSSNSSAAGYSHVTQALGGTPVKGGVLNLLGTGDVDFMDPNLVYYTVGSSAARLYSRQMYSYVAQPGKTTDIAPDMATGMPKFSSDGKSATVTIKPGVKWDTSPARQVTGADLVRGIEITCNPAQPWGGLPDYESTFVGMTTFCNGFAKVKPTTSAIKAYLSSHSISGITANGQTVTFKMTAPTPYLANILALNSTSPRPVELLNYVPGSAEDQQHQISDGPYIIKSYVPTKSIDFTRNPAWVASTDPLRKAYVDEIKVNESGTQDGNTQQLQTNSPSADLSWDHGPNSQVANGLIAQNSPQIDVESQISSNPYILFNTQSPNNNKALANVKVRQALEYALNRNHYIQVQGGPKLNVPLTHILPTQLPGGTDSVANKDFYPYNPSKAKQLLKQAGATHLTLKYLYRPSTLSEKNLFQAVQSDLAKVGITVKGEGVPDADYYVKYLEVPSQARSGAWDITAAGWGPDWYGPGSALTFFKPLFDGRALPPSSSNFGLFNDSAVNSCIDKASSAPSVSASASDWAQCDAAVMKGAAIFPVENPNVDLYHPTQVHNVIFIPQYQNFDFANVWLSKGQQGG